MTRLTNAIRAQKEVETHRDGDLQDVRAGRYAGASKAKG